MGGGGGDKRSLGKTGTDGGPRDRRGQVGRNRWGGGSMGAERAGTQVTETMKCLQEAARGILSK